MALRVGGTCGSATLYGTGTAGLLGVPSIRSTGCPRLGETVTLDIGNDAPSAYGVLMVGDFSQDYLVLGVHVLTNHLEMITHSLDATGRMTAALPIPADPRLGNLHLYFQAAYLDAAAPQLISATRGLDLWIR